MFGLTPYNRRGNVVCGRDRSFDIGSIFEDFFNDSFFTGFNAAVQPIRADIRDNGGEYVIEAEVPGVKKEDIKLDLRDDTLTISVENNMETNEERENYIRRERRYGSFSRSFYVENVKHEAVTAKYDDGILRIKLPKNEGEAPKKRDIEIQ